jgi:uncharacterized protein (TIGR00251 family)
MPGNLPEVPTLSLTLKVKPGSRRKVAPTCTDGILQIAVNAPPVDGKANAAVIAALSDLFALPKSAFELTHGSTGRQKRVVITAGTEALLKITQTLEGLAPAPHSQ